VPLTGDDVWRLVRLLRVPLRCFVLPIVAPGPGPGRFLLAAAGPFWQLQLARTAGEQGSCQFLVDFSGGYRRCGVYAARPAVCRAYPVGRHATAGLRPVAGRVCPQGAFERDDWTAGLDWPARLDELTAELELERLAVEDWNSRVAGLAPGEEATPDHFLAFQLRLRRLVAAEPHPATEARVLEILKSLSA
jgi:Fe-S-cluster containining protein